MRCFLPHAASKFVRHLTSLRFVIAPPALNAMEMFAAYTYAEKKTRASITIALQQLLAAAVMNNSFCLFIFLTLIAVRELEWNFHAEFVTIIFVQASMAVFALKRVHRLLDAVFVLLLYPTSIVLVYVLSNTVFRKAEQASLFSA